MKPPAWFSRPFILGNSQCTDCHHFPDDKKEKQRNRPWSNEKNGYDDERFRKMKRICVFCGSSLGAKPLYGQVAVGLGHALADRGIGLVYGGAGIGLMGKIANAVLEKGGEVVGVVPRLIMEKEVAHTGLADLRIVDTMHERKAMMAALSDGFIALPGGLGTIEEFVEVLTWLQLEMHRKPCGLLNIDGYYDKFLSFLNHVTAEQFLCPAHRNMVLVDEYPNKLLEKFTRFEPPAADKADWALKMNQSI